MEAVKEETMELKLVSELVVMLVVELVMESLELENLKNIHKFIIASYDVTFSWIFQKKKMKVLSKILKVLKEFS